MRYRVGITCLIEDYIIVEVDASSPEEAEDKAVVKAEADWDSLRTESQFVVDKATEV